MRNAPEVEGLWAAVARGEAAGGDGLASIVMREGAAGSAGAMEEVEAKDEENVPCDARAEAGRVAAVKGPKGPRMGGAVVRAQVCEGAGRAQGSEGAVGRAKVNIGTVVEAHDTEGATLSRRVTLGAGRETHVAR